MVMCSFVIKQTGLAQQKVVKERSSQIAPEKIKTECKFFSGDTLAGFPFEATVSEGIKKFDLYVEFKWYMHIKEIEFVKNKYHIVNFPWELIKNDNKRLVIHPKIQNAACNNIDFENGNFGGWIGEIGYNSNSNTSLTNTAAGINTL